MGEEAARCLNNKAQANLKAAKAANAEADAAKKSTRRAVPLKKRVSATEKKSGKSSASAPKPRPIVDVTPAQPPATTNTAKQYFSEAAEERRIMNRQKEDDQWDSFYECGGGGD